MPRQEAAAHPRLATIPFAAERQYMASLHPYADGVRLIVKGAIELHPANVLCRP